MSALGPVVDNVAAARFELAVEGGVAFVDYELTGDNIVLTHTEVPLASRGRGVGSALVRGVLELARARGLAVVPVCPFIVSYLRSHPNDRDLVLGQSGHRFDGE